MILRPLAKHLISLLPRKVALAKSGAFLPPVFRNALTVRFLNAVATRCAGVPADLDTNFWYPSKVTRENFVFEVNAALWCAPFVCR